MLEWRRTELYWASKADAVAAHAFALESWRMGKLPSQDVIAAAERRAREKLAEMALIEGEDDPEGAGAIYTAPKRRPLSRTAERVLECIRELAVDGVAHVGPGALARAFPDRLPKKISEYFKVLDSSGFIRTSGNAKRYRIEVVI